MPKFLIQASYTQEGLQGLIKEGGSSRRTAVQQTVESVGGKLEAFYYAFGESDLFVIADVPDNVSAVAASITAGASGSARVKTTVLITSEEMDQAARKAVTYRSPGG